MSQSKWDIAVMLLEEPDKRCLGDNGWVKYMKIKQDLTICRYFWAAKGDVKGVLLAVHGHGSYTQHEYCRSGVSSELISMEIQTSRRILC